MKKFGYLILLVSLLVSPGAFAAKAASDLPVTSSVSDANAGGIAYYVQSDGLGPYQNGVWGVQSILQGLSQNGLSGDWILDTYNSNLSRNVLVTLTAANAVQIGQPGYTAPANPPFWGTALEPSRFIAKCSSAPYYISIKAIKPGAPAYCPLLLHFGPTLGSGRNTSFYRLDMGHSYQFPSEPETQDVQVSCNAVDATGNCNDWAVDSIPPVSQGGGPGVNQVRARLNLVGGSTTYTNEGDFYLTFHIRITNP
jgi:hypothetical protein